VSWGEKWRGGCDLIEVSVWVNFGEESAENPGDKRGLGEGI
jgi:hypothetical protein